jgi:uncharacterized membrane protein YqhA
MVAKLLESGEPKLQVLGTNSVSKTILLLILSLISISGIYLFLRCFYVAKAQSPVRAFGQLIQIKIFEHFAFDVCCCST